MIVPIPHPRPITKPDRVSSSLVPPNALLDQAASALKRTFAADSNNGPALWRLGDILRMQGDLDAACEVYRRLSACGPDRRKASWVSALLSDAVVPEPPEPRGVWPAPFVWMASFLSTEECDRLFALALTGRFAVAKVVGGLRGRGYVNPDVRVSLEADERTRREFLAWFLPKIERTIPKVMARLHPKHPGRYRGVSARMRVYPTGGFFRFHKDNSNESSGDRLLSFVCFFHREPRDFSGGDLLLYDTNIKGSRPVVAFSRLEPRRGGVVFFRSETWHQVTPITCDADDSGAGRFVVNGHVHE